MKFTKPVWVAHKDNSDKTDTTSKRLSIFSIHVHPDGSRIATGGLDAKIRIWSTKPILSPKAEASVLTVRWAHSGRWLASGSDDEIVMIWDLDPNSKGKVWGSDEVNVEGWKPLKRLPGHESDVTDVAWSPGDRYLASVGLDSKIMIWCGFTLERLQKLDQHQGFVKGVCWDPVGEFLATQSDDRSVKIWRTTDWGLEAEIRKPFEDSPGSTFFRRLSWSPDGAHITASNATNNKGFVFIAAVITRNIWTSDISLVGHENTVEVACYNPHIFFRNPDAPLVTANICSVVALGADDRSVSVWQTKSARPLIVAREVFDRQIMDLSWSWDGLTLYAASSDGTIAVFDFDPDELEGIATHEMQAKYLKKFPFVSPPLPEGYSHNVPTKPTPSSSRITPPPSPTRTSAQPQTQQVGFGAPVQPGAERVNLLVAKRTNKRLAPTLLGPKNSAGASVQAPASSRTIPSSRSTLAEAQAQIPSASSPRDSPRYLSGGLIDEDSAMHWEGDSEMDVQIDSLDVNVSPDVKGKRRADEEKSSRSRTLGGDRPRETIISRPLGPSSMTSGAWINNASQGVMLQTPQLLTFLSVKLEGSEDLFEGKNSEDAPSEVQLVSGKQTQWLDFVPSNVLALTATTFFCAAALQDGSVNVYSLAGRRLMPTLTLGSPCYALDSCRNTLMAITSGGQLYVWNVKKSVAVFPPVSVLPVLGASPDCTIVSTSLRPNGAPIIQCSNGTAHSFDINLSSWVKLSERWWSEGSDAWQGRQRNTQTYTGRGIVALVEGALANVETDESSAGTPRPQWWSSAMTLGHLESKLHASKVLDSPQEFKQVLLVYAKKIADEGFRAKAEELIRELFGPIYWRPGRDDSWTPIILGMLKRDLLKDVLSVFARSKTFPKLASDWQDMLKKAGSDES